MPLVRARCSECSQPLADPPHVPVPMQCGACGAHAMLSVAADGQPAEFDASFSPGRLLKWFAAARRAMASGTPGVAVGACPRCDTPLVVSSRAPVALPCPHCKKPVQGTADEVLVDQWPEPWAKIEGGPLSLEYRLAWIDDTMGIPGGCPACGTPSHPDDPHGRCRRCGAATWVQRGDRRRQLAVRVSGTRGDKPANATVSLAQGDALLRSDQAQGASAQSGNSLLGVTGIGCAISFAVTLLLAVGVAIAVHFSK